MQQAAIHNFLEHFFIANECEFLENKDGLLKVKLTVALDKLLMNRSFYWHYIEKIGGVPETTTLTLKTAPSEEKDGELIHFGSPRLHQIFRAAKQLAPYIRLYQETGSEGNFTPLVPWLGINFKISYQCDLKKDDLLSLGLHLMNGTIATHFHEQLLQMPLTPKIPDYCYTLTPMIKPISGLKRLEHFIEQKIQNDDHQWADNARIRWQKDQSLLDQFYEDQTNEEAPDTYVKEKEALKEQYEPKVNVQIINGGLFYLDKSSFLHTT
ncbi:YqhG family protein [Scopulibacillus cellulosilyticus]|uniref:YqhG family protein n=1 Tax=Scopulibacillus cellulosilyticus TaxID=2665665 RepID=A0ABW2PY41_9BACL